MLKNGMAGATALQPGNCSGALMMVIGPTRDSRQEFHTRYLLEKACLEDTGHWFSQANSRPLLQQPILKQFGEIRTNWPLFKKVLSGTMV